MLTDKQERFVQELLKGKSQREAYRASYNCLRASDKTVDNKAYALFKKSEVRARYDELHHNAIKRTVDDAESIRAFMIETYKKMASGELCKQKTVMDKYGSVIRVEKEVAPSDVNTAMQKLAELYGVTANTGNNEIVVRFETGEDYSV